MGKIRYYCEYCDRSFLDDLDVRKRHLNGTLHIRQRKSHYNQFRDAKSILEEESHVERCKRFLFYNNCPFGENCKFSHYSPADLEYLRQQVECEETAKAKAHSVEAALAKLPSVEKLNLWLTARLGSDKAKKSGMKLLADLSSVTTMPPSLQGYSNLPPSLQPWDLNNCGALEVEEWG